MYRTRGDNLKAQANAIELCELLRQHSVVTKVHYIAPDDVHGDGPSAQEARLHFSQATGGGALMSFETGDLEISRAFVAAASAKRGGLFKQTVSFGSTSSLVEIPNEMSHASIPESERDGHLPPDLVRLSIGIEDSNDLVAALGAALGAAQAVAPSGMSRRATWSGESISVTYRIGRELIRRYGSHR